MRATLHVELQPFTVPNFVIGVSEPGHRGDELVELPAYPLHQLDPETLYAMCREFTHAVFEKAGKCEPPEW